MKMRVKKTRGPTNPTKGKDKKEERRKKIPHVSQVCLINTLCFQVHPVRTQQQTTALETPSLHPIQGEELSECDSYLAL